MLKAVIFDLGGVYLNAGIRIAFKQKFMKMFGLSTNEKGHTPVFFEHLYAGGFMDNRINEAQYWELCERDLGVKINSRELRKVLLSAYKEQKEVTVLVKRLRKKYVLGLLSDMPKEWAEWLEKKFHIFENFDEIVVSGFVGITKPNPKGYQLMLKKLGLQAKECIFIDDIAHNLDYPQKLGMKTILFENAKQLRRELKRLGIKF